MPSHYHYATCGHAANPANKDFAQSRLAHVQFCDLYNGGHSDKAVHFEAVEVSTARTTGLCPACCAKAGFEHHDPTSVLAPQLFRSRTVAHHTDCGEGRCGRRLIITKGVTHHDDATLRSKGAANTHGSTSRTFAATSNTESSFQDGLVIFSPPQPQQEPVTKAFSERERAHKAIFEERGVACHCDPELCDAGRPTDYVKSVWAEFAKNKRSERD